MRVRATEVSLKGARIGVALVDIEFIGPSGNALIEKIQHFFPFIGIMLVAIVDHGYRAHAHFRTGQFLALLQLEELTFTEIDLDHPPVKDEETPF